MLTFGVILYSDVLKKISRSATALPNNNRFSEDKVHLKHHSGATWSDKLSVAAILKTQLAILLSLDFQLIVFELVVNAQRTGINETFTNMRCIGLHVTFAPAFVITVTTTNSQSPLNV